MHFKRIRDIAADRARGEQVEMLKNHPNLLAGSAGDFRVPLDDILILDQNFPHIRLFQTRPETAHERRFPRSTLPDDAKNISLLNLQGHLAQRLDLVACRGGISWIDCEP